MTCKLDELENYLSSLSAGYFIFKVKSSFSERKTVGVISRGIKNAFRNGVRTISIVFILALSIAMSIIMFMSLRAVQNKIDNVKSTIGNTITVSPAGVRGFEGGGALLTNENANDIKTLAHVANVIETMNGRLTTIGTTNTMPFRQSEDSDSNAQTSLTAPPIKASSDNSSDNGTGRQQRLFVNGQSVNGGNFSMPITVIGINDLSNIALLNASSFTVTSGEKIDAKSNDNVAMLGKDLASQNSLAASETFTAYGRTITIKGIFDAGNGFADGMIIMPIATVQNLSGNSDEINSLLVIADSVDSLNSVQTAIKDKLGGSVDVTTSEQSAQNAVLPLENIKTIAEYSLIGALAAGSVIIFLIMMMIARERRREIGVLKAIGSSNANIVAQFTVESLVLTLTSSLAGIILGVIFSNPVLKVLINNSQSDTPGKQAFYAGRQSFGGGRGGEMVMRMADSFQSAGNTLRDLHAVVGWQIILYGLVAAAIIAIIGSTIPAFIIAKIRPAEVMRAE